MIDIQLNGENKTLPAGLTIASAIDLMKYSSQNIAVAVNMTFVPKSQHATVILKAGDSVEFVSPMQGG